MAFHFKTDKSGSQLPVEIRSLLQGRREMFSQTPSVLPQLHRRIRAAAMERSSLRQTLRVRFTEWFDLVADLDPLVGLRYAGTAAAVALALFVGLQQSWKSNDGGNAPLLTLNQPINQSVNQGAGINQVSYSLNDLNGLPVSLDQKIDQVMADASDMNHDAVSAHYVLTSTPANYDSVVAF